jgi:hypothetical protein
MIVFVFAQMSEIPSDFYSSDEESAGDDSGDDVSDGD